MGKKNGNELNGMLVIPESVVDKIIAAINGASEKENERYEKEQQMNAEEYQKEKEMVKKEFARVAKIMEKTDPSSQEYYTIANNIDKLSDILKYWH